MAGKTQFSERFAEMTVEGCTYKSYIGFPVVETCDILTMWLPLLSCCRVRAGYAAERNAFGLRAFENAGTDILQAVHCRSSASTAASCKRLCISVCYVAVANVRKGSGSINALIEFLKARMERQKNFLCQLRTFPSNHEVSLKQVPCRLHSPCGGKHCESSGVICSRSK